MDRQIDLYRSKLQSVESIQATAEKHVFKTLSNMMMEFFKKISIKGV